MNEAIAAQRICLAVVLNNPDAYINDGAEMHLKTFSRVINGGRLRIAEITKEIKKLEQQKE